MKTHFRYLPSTRKLVARLKREVNAASSMCAELERWRRTPLNQRDVDGVMYNAPTTATVLCATLAHVRGRIHAGKWDPEGQVAWICAHMTSLRGHVREMVAEALKVPAREKARLADHIERKAAHAIRNGTYATVVDDAMPAIARRCGAV